jgi:hypothetical protein
MTLSKHSIRHLSRKKHSPTTTACFSSRIKSGLFLLACLDVIFLSLSCKKEPTQADATTELLASFEDSPAKEDVIKANTAFTEGRYKETLNLLHKVVGSGVLTERQKKAMAGIVGQLLKAIHEDPQLSKDTQIHRSMQLLVRRTMGET